MSVSPGAPAPAPSALPNPGVATAGSPTSSPTPTPNPAQQYSSGIQNMQAQYNASAARSTPGVTSGYDASAANGMTHQQAGQYGDDLNTAYNIGNNQFKLANQATDQANQGQQMAVKQNQNTQLGGSRQLSGMGYPTQPAQVTGIG